MFKDLFLYVVILKVTCILYSNTIFKIRKSSPSKNNQSNHYHNKKSPSSVAGYYLGTLNLIIGVLYVVLKTVTIIRLLQIECYMEYICACHRQCGADLIEFALNDLCVLPWQEL